MISLILISSDVQNVDESLIFAKIARINVSILIGVMWAENRQIAMKMLSTNKCFRESKL